MAHWRTCSNAIATFDMTQRKLATLTIGQAPRSDITPILQASLPADQPCVHAGVLDGLSLAQIQQRFTPQPGEAVLVSRLLDGSAVTLGKGAVHLALQQKIDQLVAQGMEIIAILCTGEFSHLNGGSAWLVEPDQILPATLAALVGQRQAGVIVPLAQQMESEKAKWRGVTQPPIFAVASPYDADTQPLAQAAAQLAANGAEVIVLDCMGYTGLHQQICRQHSGLPVILSNQLLAHLLTHLL